MKSLRSTGQVAASAGLLQVLRSSLEKTARSVQHGGGLRAYLILPSPVHSSRRSLRGRNPGRIPLCPGWRFLISAIAAFPSSVCRARHQQNPGPAPVQPQRRMTASGFGLLHIKNFLLFYGNDFLKDVGHNKGLEEKLDLNGWRPPRDSLQKMA